MFFGKKPIPLMNRSERRKEKAHKAIQNHGMKNDVKVEDQQLQQVKKDKEQQQHPLEVGLPQPQLDDVEEKEPNDESLDHLHPCLSKLRGSREKKRALANWLNSPHVERIMAPDGKKYKNDKVLLKLMTGNRQRIKHNYIFKKVRDGNRGKFTWNVSVLVGDIKVRKS